jgi:molybdopterin-containing oxidoreductase family iron-sulfur binding subunit
MLKHHSTQRNYWRSLEHLSGTQEMRELAAKEFASYDPAGLIEMGSVTRRRFMKLMGASMALAGMTLEGCRRWPQEKLAPYTSNPANRLPGVPAHYATIMELDGVGIPLLVRSFDGRPIKIEGNPTHPYSQTFTSGQNKYGAADSLAQSTTLEIYDPDRSTSVIDRSSGTDKAKTIPDFQAALTALVNSAAGQQGSGFAILAQSSIGPSAARLKAAMMAKLPQAKWYEYQPLSRDNEFAGSKLALGKPARQVLHLDAAKVVVLLDADPLGTHPAHIKYSSDWASWRRAATIPISEGMANTADTPTFSRVYSIESSFTISGSVADARLPVKPSRIGAILTALSGGDGQLNADESKFVDRIKKDLDANKGSSVVVVGSHLSPQIHAAALALNASIGAIPNVLSIHEEPNADRPSHLDAITDLATQAKAGKINTLLIFGGNPVYDAPSDLKFSDAIKAVAATIHLSLFDNETSKVCKWHVPAAHYLEAWDDARAWDGTISVGQPLIEPLYGGLSANQILSWIAGEAETDTDAIVRKTFAGIIGGGADFDLKYRQVLHDGLVPNTAFAAITATPKATGDSLVTPENKTFEVRFLQDSRVYDGRFAGNGWLQELPDPLTKLIWDNAALLSKTDADAASITTGDKISIKIGSRELVIVAYVLPGQPVGVIGLPLGYGRTDAGHIGTLVGFDTYQLRSSDGFGFATGATISKTGETYALALTQNHQIMDTIGNDARQERVGEARSSADIIFEATIGQYANDPEIFKKRVDEEVSTHQLFDQKIFEDEHKWGMSIDLSSCIGCHACVIACQAENNVPIVGKDQAMNNRQMHWIRIDRYFKSEKNDPDPLANPEVVYQPLACQHCENAPCEQVCPVGATMHDSEGLNVMVYNRCIGTRYCSNNCPYKVRRFNYLDWQSQDPRNDKYPKPYLKIPDMQQEEMVPEVKRMVFNPEVTVRMRGVMEKCTYCVQRIHNTKITRRAAGQDLQDGDIVTACQQACPTQAIVFGDLKDPNSRVSKLQASGRNYDLLADLDTRPRTRYMAKLSNPPEA